jgi:RimJ/RimL family protein N-acetyltransferase
VALRPLCARAVAPPITGIWFERFTPAETDLLADFLASEPWPFHSGQLDRDEVRRAVADGYYDGDSARTYWINAQDDHVGLIRLFDLGDSTPMFDLRIRAADRGRGIGGQALAWIAGHVFGTLPGASRIEGTTRQDDIAMRRAFRRAGWVQEAHYWSGGRLSWSGGIARPTPLRSSLARASYWPMVCSGDGVIRGGCGR